MMSQHYVGILMMSSIVTHGRNKKGNIIKTFKSTTQSTQAGHDRQPFQAKVATSLKTTVDQYVIVEISQVDLTKPFQQGILVEMIGPVGDATAERNYILAKHNINFKPYSKTYTRKTFQDTIDACQERYTNAIAERVPFHTDCVFSIDPPGCTDIDDCISLQQCPDKYILTIHIADVDALVPPTHDEHLAQRPTSVYMDHKCLSMLPDPIIEWCSLLPNQQRLAHSIMIEIPTTLSEFPESLYELQYTIIETTITSQKAFTYQQVNNALKYNKCDKYNLQQLNELTAQLNQHFHLPVSVDPAHRIVETCMLLANALVGHHMYTRQMACNNGITGWVARQHAGPLADNSQCEKNVVGELADHLNKVTSMAAEYCYIPANESSHELSAIQHSHAGLSLKHYVHFTSPIRRYADVITHRILKNPTYLVNPHHVTSINLVNKQIKRATRDEKKLAIVYAMEDKGSLGVNAYITEFQPRFIRVWISHYDVTHAVEIFSSNQAHYIQTNQTDDILTISNTHTCQSATLQRYQRVKVTIVPFPHQTVFNKKLNITINRLDGVYEQ